MADRLAYSVPETASMLGVSEQTVRTYISIGVLNATQPLGKGSKVLIPADSLDRLLAAVTPPAEPVTA